MLDEIALERADPLVTDADAQAEYAYHLSEEHARRTFFAEGRKQ